MFITHKTNARFIIEEKLPQVKWKMEVKCLRMNNGSDEMYLSAKLPTGFIMLIDVVAMMISWAVCQLIIHNT